MRDTFFFPPLNPESSSLAHQAYLGKEICGVADGAMNWPSESVVMNNL